MAMSVVYSNAFGGTLYENRGGTVSTYVRDTLGSTIGLMNSSGTLTDRWEYWPYGEVASRTGTNATPFTFLGVLGYFKDVLDKLFYVRARHLRVDLARWLTVDPLWPRQSAYGYCAGRPVLLADAAGAGWCEDGLDSCKEECAKIVLAVAGIATIVGCVVGCIGDMVTGCVGGCVAAAVAATMAAVFAAYWACMADCETAYVICTLGQRAHIW